MENSLHKKKKMIIGITSEEDLNKVLKTVQFKYDIPTNGVRGTSNVTLHNNARKRYTKAIISHLSTSWKILVEYGIDKKTKTKRYFLEV